MRGFSVALDGNRGRLYPLATSHKCLSLARRSYWESYQARQDACAKLHFATVCGVIFAYVWCNKIFPQTFFFLDNFRQVCGVKADSNESKRIEAVTVE